ncbi:MAG: hypothetical protein R3Y11_02945 [Pseudomonadota bacterium]
MIEILPDIWANLIKPLLRLLCYMSIGLVVANIIEAMNWTRGLAKLAGPLVRLGHMRDVAGTSFSIAFISAISANSLLSQSYDNGEISKRELIFANLFNSLPANLTHLPTLFIMTYSAIGWPAVVYMSLTVGAAALRTVVTILAGRVLLPPLSLVPEGCVSCRLDEHKEKSSQGFRARVDMVTRRLRKRLPKIVYFTVPVYVFMFMMQRLGCFQTAQDWLAGHIGFIEFLKPEAVGIVVFHLVAEFGAALAAASSVFTNGTLSEKDIVLALLVGNILSTPMRAFRHQFPSYAGYFKPSLAFNLVVANQLLRAASIIFMAWLYYLWA